MNERWDIFTRYKASTHLQWDVSGVHKSNVDSLGILIRLLLQAYIIGERNQNQLACQKDQDIYIDLHHMIK